MEISKKIVLWGAWYGSKNVGDQLLLLSIADLIDQYLVGENTIYTLTDKATWVNEYSVRESTSKIIAIQSRQEIPRLISILRNCNLFIFGGGVPFFDNPRQVLVMFSLIFWIKLFRRPYMTWAVSSQKVQKWYSKLIYRWVLKGATLLTCRDTETFGMMQRLTRDEKPIYRVADSGFSLDYDINQGQQILLRNGWQEDDRPLAALTPRTLRMPDGESETHYRLHRADEYERELNSFTATLDWLWEKGFQPVFIPMNTVAPDDDLLAAREIISRSKYGQFALLIDEVLRPREVPGIYAQCQISYVARVHGSICSFLANTPMMMFAFASKHKGIMKSMDMEEYALHGDSATPDRTLETLENLLSKRTKIKAALSDKKVELRKQAHRTAELMVEHVFN
jgi:polysaccharide pyruvyl transferase WcaK-like protein